jgi:hypothetical protein
MQVIRVTIFVGLCHREYAGCIESHMAGIFSQGFIDVVMLLLPLCGISLGARLGSRQAYNASTKRSGGDADLTK